MRLVYVSLSALLLSGCSWFGGYGHAPGSAHTYGHGQQFGYHGGQAAGTQRCQIQAPTHPVPQGCHPSQVTIATGNGFAQKPNFSQVTQTTGQYGSHADRAETVWGGYIRPGHKRKPVLRGTLSAGFEKSNSGNIIDYTKIPGINPELTYNPDAFRETSVQGSPSSGSVTTTTYSAQTEQINKPSISFDDAHSTPFRVAGGLEYILTPNFTTFANVGYTYSEGNSGSAIGVDGRLTRTVTTQGFDSTTGNPVGSPVTSGQFIPNQPIANYEFNFSDMERLDAEVGGRYYFNPVATDVHNRTVTPFVGASAGLARYNGVDVNISQNQLFYQRAFDSNGETLEYYNVPPNPSQQVKISESQTVPTGALTAGLEWQLTPKWGMAFETGLRYEGARDYANGAKGDENLIIPVTLRGSFNF